MEGQNMKHKKEQKGRCQICRQLKKLGELMPAELVHSAIVERIIKKYPDWSSSGYICLSDLNHFRIRHIEDLLENEKGILTHLEEDVFRSMREQEPLSRNIQEEYDRQLTFGDRVADAVANFGGSWPFIIGFFVFLLIWMGINSVLFLWRPYDPYPFILLNLVLSCLAAVQAPIIMMSQNRQGEKDRLRAENDYQVNLKAEIEIRHLHEKIDHLVLRQWQRLLEIQQVQLEVMDAPGSK
jgi:uncharacterized membrane protein